jgi:hypothetical protein
MTFNGEVTMDDSQQTRTFVMESLKDLRGNVISETMDGLPIEAEGGGYASDLILPESPVKSGDTWQSRIMADPLVSAITYRLVGSVDYKGAKAYAIEGSFVAGERLQDDPGYRLIVNAKSLRTLRLVGGFKSNDGIIGRFDAESDP